MGRAYQIKNQNGIYFLTFQVVGWADIFTRKIYRDIIIEALEFYRIHKGLLVFAYVVMSNHIHVIWKARDENLSNLVRDFKKRTSKIIMNEVSNNPGESRREWLEMIFKYHSKFNKRSLGRQLWTHENHAIELDNNRMIDQRINYIHQNPVKAGWVLKEEDYLYSSASFFVNDVGILEIDEI